MASACNAQFADVEFEAALSNSLQHFLHNSGLKYEQKLCQETVALKRDVIRILLKVASHPKCQHFGEKNILGYKDRSYSYLCLLKEFRKHIASMRSSGRNSVFFTNCF